MLEALQSIYIIASQAKLRAIKHDRLADYHDFSEIYQLAQDALADNFRAEHQS